jgi:hypothetical protein
VAFDFWVKSYASQPLKLPESWKKFEECDPKTVLEFMFCLETTHTILARLILAKICEDYSFPGLIGIKGIKNTIVNYRENVPSISYPIFLKKLLFEMKEALIESIFEEDIYFWWTDSIKEYENKSSKDLWDISIETILLNFSSAIRKIIFSIARFNLLSTQHDLLGNLYQTYFDKETRKALGEFYTKEQVVSYILNEVNYSDGISYKRLLDPCCGSGTFVVNAVRRYLIDADKRLPKSELKYGTILRDLCLNPRIVALDIHPFAVIMTQIRLMIELIPVYIKAIKEDDKFFIRRLPVFRTDSLEQETKSADRAVWRFGTDTIEITMELPIRLKENEFYKIKIAVPDRVLLSRKGKLSNASEYFSSVQALFDTIKQLSNREIYEPNIDLLETNLAYYISNKDYKELSAIYAPICKEILSVIHSLKYDFGDGRLVKSIEDVVLASILKNYLLYDFVVANPPYIRAFRGEKESRIKYRDLYSTPFGSFDTYIVFIERFIELLNENGKIGIITSNKYFVNDYAIYLRPFILNNCYIQELIDLTGCPDAFEEPLICASILIAEKANKEINLDKNYNNKLNKEILISLVKYDDINIINDISDIYKTKKIIDDEKLETYWIKQNELPRGMSGNWEVFVTPKNKEIIEKIYNNSTLLGCETVADIRGGIRGTEYSNAEKYTIEGEPEVGIDNVKILNVGSINKFTSNYGHPIKYRWKYYKYPHIIYDSEFFSKTLWDTFKAKKIIVRGVAKELTSFYDAEGVGFFRSIWSIIIKCDINPKLIIGFLNSKLFDFIHKVRLRTARIPQGSYSYPMSFIKEIPLKYPKEENELKTANEIVSLVSNLELIAIRRNKISLFPESYLKEITETHEEIIIPDRDYSTDEIYIGKNLLNYLIIGFGTKQTYTTSLISNELNDKYLNEIIKNIIFRKGQREIIKYPHNITQLQAILDELDKDKFYVDESEQKYNENILNELVYNYYNIDSKEKNIIEKIHEELSINISDEEDE